MEQSDKVKTGFSRRIDKAVKCHQELLLAVHNKLNQAALETMLVEQFAMQSAVQWESFLNDLISTYAVMRPEAAIKSLENRIDQSIQTRFGELAAKFTSFKITTPLTRAKVIELLDPKDWNITVKSANELFSKANEILAAEYAKRFSLDKADAQFFDFAIALRNYLGHRSVGSRSELKAAIKSLSEVVNGDFQAKLHDIGTYLKVKTPNGKSRAILFTERLAQISAKF